MFLGHFAVALGAKPVAPKVSLGTLFVACQLADLVWPFLVLAGIERVEVEPGNTAFTPLHFISYPYSHSALALAVWGLLFGFGYKLLRGSTVRVALVLAIVVFSHFLLDALTHTRDMPLSLHGYTRVGLGLWNSIPWTLAVELSLFLHGLWRYSRSTFPADKTGRYSLIGLVVFLLVVYAAAAFGPPPPSSTAVAVSALAMWLLVAWGYFVDAHRIPLAPVVRCE